MQEYDRKIKIIGYILLAILIIVPLEIISFYGGTYLQGKGVFYVPQEVKDYNNYKQKRDPNLGWSSHYSFKQVDIDKTGSRVIPAYPDPDKHEPCVSLYGDSFTWAEGVSNEYAWSNQLSKLMNCRVANYGVAAYGTDQAYLRFRLNKNDTAKIVIIGHLSENIMRNVNQFRTLLYSQIRYGLTPRYIISDTGDLELIPLQLLEEKEYVDLVNNPELYLEHEYFIPDGKSGLSRLKFPYTISIIRAFNHFHVRSKLLGKPWYTEFYNFDHPSEGIIVTSRIIEEFRNEAISRDKTPVVIIIPTCLDIKFYEKKDVWVYGNLLKVLKEKNIKVLNTGEGIVDYLDKCKDCQVYEDMETCYGHFTEEGNKVFAEIIFKYLKNEDIIK